MANLAGITQRLRIVLSALTRASAQLPIPIQDSTYYDAVRVGGDGAGVAVACADLFNVLDPCLPDGVVSKPSSLHRFSHLCRDRSADKNACEPDVGRLLYQLVRLIRPACAIEVGVYKGAASCHIAQALKENAMKTQLHLVDISEAFLDITRRQLQAFGLDDYAVFHCADAADITDREELPQAEFIFLDAQNSEKSVERYLNNFLPLVKPGGFLLLHNTILWNGARTNANRLTLDMPGAVLTLATSGGSGISVVRKGGSVA